MMSLMNNLKVYVWWKRVLYFLPFLLAAIGLAVWYFLRPKPVSSSMTVARARGKIIDAELEATIDAITDLEQSIHETADARQEKIRKLRALASKRGVKDEIINRAIANGDFDAITKLIQSTFTTTNGENN